MPTSSVRKRHQRVDGSLTMQQPLPSARQVWAKWCAPVDHWLGKILPTLLARRRRCQTDRALRARPGTPVLRRARIRFRWIRDSQPLPISGMQLRGCVRERLVRSHFRCRGRRVNRLAAGKWRPIFVVGCFASSLSPVKREQGKHARLRITL